MKLASLVNKTVFVRIALIAAGLSLANYSELDVGNRLLPKNISDSMHVLFAPVNAFLNANPHLADATLIAITLPVDIAGICLIVWSILEKASALSLAYF